MIGSADGMAMPWSTRAVAADRISVRDVLIWAGRAFMVLRVSRATADDDGCPVLFGLLGTDGKHHELALDGNVLVDVTDDRPV